MQIIRLTCFAVAKLESMSFSYKGESLARVFEGLQVEEVDFSPVLQMAVGILYLSRRGARGQIFGSTNYLTFRPYHSAVMNPDGRKSRSNTAHSVSDVVSKGTDQLLDSLDDSYIGKRKQDVLKALVRCVAA